jgi:hypothetical protein
VPFSHDLRKRLYRFAKWQAAKNIQSHLIFAGLGGASWEKRNSTTSLYLLQQTPKFGWHRLRHTFATNYLRWFHQVMLIGPLSRRRIVMRIRIAILLMICVGTTACEDRHMKSTAPDTKCIYSPGAASPDR